MKYAVGSHTPSPNKTPLVLPYLLYLDISYFDILTTDIS